jgi:hypothetical protein
MEKSHIDVTVGHRFDIAVFEIRCDWPKYNIRRRGKIEYLLVYIEDGDVASSTGSRPI